MRGKRGRGQSPASPALCVLTPAGLPWTPSPGRQAGSPKAVDYVRSRTWARLLGRGVLVRSRCAPGKPLGWGRDLLLVSAPPLPPVPGAQQGRLPLCPDGGEKRSGGEGQIENQPSGGPPIPINRPAVPGPELSLAPRTQPSARVWAAWVCTWLPAPDSRPSRGRRAQRPLLSCEVPLGAVLPTQPVSACCRIPGWGVGGCWRLPQNSRDAGLPAISLPRCSHRHFRSRGLWTRGEG